MTVLVSFTTKCATLNDLDLNGHCIDTGLLFDVVAAIRGHVHLKSLGLSGNECIKTGKFAPSTQLQWLNGRASVFGTEG